MLLCINSPLIWALGLSTQTGIPASERFWIRHCPRNMALGTFRELLIVFDKGKFVIPPLFNGLEVFSSASDKQNWFLKTFVGNLILLTRVSLYLFSLLQLI